MPKGTPPGRLKEVGTFVEGGQTMSDSGTERTPHQTHVKYFNPADQEIPRGYSHGASASGQTVWISGHTSKDSSGKVIYPGDMAAQFGQALKNMVSTLRAAGCEPSDVTKIMYFVTDIPAYKEALPRIGKPYREIFGRNFPAATLVQVVALLEPELMIEIECVAVAR
jgi:enamine deaminase RidA (YjgF/YER057c/UK114 family)